MSKPFESWIQDLVYNVDVGIGLRIVQVLLGALAISGLAVIYQASEFKSLTSAEGMDQAQLARNYALTGKLVTRYIRPASLSYLEQHRPKNQPDAYLQWHPDIINAPLYPVLLGSAMKWTGQTQASAKNPSGDFAPEKFVILPFSHLFTLLTGLVLLSMGVYLFETRVGVMAMLSYYLSNMVWANNLNGTAIALTSFLCISAFSLAVAQYKAQENEDGTLKQGTLALLVGLLAGLAFLSRYGAIVLLPGLAVFLLWQQPRTAWKWAVVMTVGFLMVTTPWFMRNISVSGSILGMAPLTAFVNSPGYAEDTFLRKLNMGPLEIGPSIKLLQTKWLSSFPGIVEKAIPGVAHGLFGALFACSFFFRFVRDDTHRFRWSIALSLALLLVLAGYYGESTLDLLLVFLPFALIFGSGFFFLLLDRLELNIRIFNWGITALVVGLSALPLLFTLLPPRPGLPYPPYFPPYINHVSQMLEPDELICTDMPWATAWYGGRQSLQLPTTLDEFYEINDYRRKVNALYFTTVTRNKPYVRSLATGIYESWFPIFEGRLPADFPLREGFPMHNLDQLFLTDRARWER